MVLAACTKTDGESSGSKENKQYEQFVWIMLTKEKHPQLPTYPMKPDTLGGTVLEEHYMLLQGLA